ncbi:hypothetical protein C8J56DRAFT_1109723 [Mycena floridula]|nr:hypothetical protein C8J56DRAFT_1109723 [Mycena floridula]
MTPDEVALLQHVGRVYVENFAAVVALSIGYGVYALMLSLALYHLLVKRNKTWATWVLCTMLAFIFLMVTTYVCLFTANSFKLVTGAIIENPELELSERVEIADANIFQINVAQVWFGGTGSSLVFMFGDGIIVWRAWAVWTERRTVIILPAMTLLATFAIFVTWSAIETKVLVSPTNVIDGRIGALLIAGSAMSIVTNGIAVILIANIGQGKSAAGKVLMFLTESGIVYIIFQIINTYLLSVDSKPNSTLDYVQLIWALEMNIFCGIYPLLVILIVNHRHSIAHITEASRPGDGNLGTHISFAHSSPLQHTAESTESQPDAAVQGSGERHTEKVSKP